MPNQIGFVDNTSMLAHYAMLDTIRAFCLANGWTILRYNTVPVERELIMAAPGYIGPNGAVPAYCGLKTYHSVASDYYNLLVAGMTGYVSGNTFETQPGYRSSGVPAHNQRIDYWMTVNDRRIALALKVGTPVYESAYLGYALHPFATPAQFPYPLVVAGMLTGPATTRFSDAAHSMPYKGNHARMALRFVSGAYLQPFCWPWGNNTLMNPNVGDFQMRPTGTSYKPLPVLLHDNAANLYAELDGIFAITGFDNVVENTMTIDGDAYVVIQDVNRTGFVDYYALRLDPNP